MVGEHALAMRVEVFRDRTDALLLEVVGVGEGEGEGVECAGFPISAVISDT